VAIDISDLLNCVIVPTLQHIGMDSAAARRLVLGTALAESLVNSTTHLKQIRGPALGIYQCEPATHRDVRRWIDSKPVVAGLVYELQSAEPDPDAQLCGNLFYATAICRCHYRRITAPLPDAADLDALGRYWKRYYNTVLGAGQPETFSARLRKALPNVALS